MTGKAAPCRTSIHQASAPERSQTFDDEDEEEGEGNEEAEEEELENDEELSNPDEVGPGAAFDMTARPREVQPEAEEDSQASADSFGDEDGREEPADDGEEGGFEEDSASGAPVDAPGPDAEQEMDQAGH